MNLNDIYIKHNNIYEYISKHKIDIEGSIIIDNNRKYPRLFHQQKIENS